MARPRIVIDGAGFAGHHAARALLRGTCGYDRLVRLGSTAN